MHVYNRKRCTLSLHFEPAVWYRMLVVKCCMLLPAVIYTKTMKSCERQAV